jgi:GT2 family glycosyltransferase
MVVQRGRFEAVGGFDPERFAVSFNDVDLCLRLAQRGWKTLYEPRASLVHHESVSRGLDFDAEGANRQAREVKALQDLWNTQLAQTGQAPQCADPFHHPGLSPLSEHFVLRI